MQVTKKKCMAFSCIIAGMIFFISCLQRDIEKGVAHCDIDTIIYKEHVVDIENHQFKFLLPEDYFYHSKQLPELMVNEYFGKALFYSRNNNKNYFFMETADAKDYLLDNGEFEKSIICNVKRRLMNNTGACIYYECYKADKYKYYVVVSFSRSPTNSEGDTIVTEFIWNILYDDKLYWHTLHSEEYFKDFSYAEKMRIMHSIRIE